MINIDEKNYEYCTIDRDTWLKSTLGEPVQHDAIDELLDKINTSNEWLSNNEPRIKAEIEILTGREYTVSELMNTYNDENDFDGDFLFCVFSPAEDTSCGEWYYSSDVYVAVQRHLGGDVRGNYGNVELFGPVDSLADGYFLDWTLGWYATDLAGKTIAESDETGIGYAQNPTCHLAELFKTGRHDWEVITRFSKKFDAFMARTNEGRTALLTPYTNAEYC